MARGWKRTLPLHILIGGKHLTPILHLEPLSFFFFLESESTEADFATRAIKFTFRGEGQCKSARHILVEKNNALKLANLTGQFSTALTISQMARPCARQRANCAKNSSKCPSSSSVSTPYAARTTTISCVTMQMLGARSHARVHARRLLHLMSSPLLGCNNTTGQGLNMSAQLTFNTTKPPLNLCSPKSKLHHEGMMPLHEAIACAVDHGDNQLQQQRRRSILRLATYECQIICNQLNQVRNSRSISSCWHFKCPRASTVTTAPIRLTNAILRLLTVRKYYK